MKKTEARIFGFVFLATSLMGICVVTYELTQPFFEKNQLFINGLFEVPLSKNLERVGVFLQLLAGLSVIPELIGENKLHNAEANLRQFRFQLQEAKPLFLLFKSETNHVANKAEQSFVLATTLLWMVSIIVFWAYPLISPKYTITDTNQYSCIMLLILGTVGITGRLMAEALVAIAFGFVSFLAKLLPFKRLAVAVTFPLFLIGTLLQLIATFM